MEKKYTLIGLDCPNCAMKLENALNKQKHVKKASITFATLLCVIEYEEYNDEIEHHIIHFIEDFDEDVKVVKKEHTHTHEHHEHKHEHCNCGHDHRHHEETEKHDQLHESEHQHEHKHHGHHNHDEKCCCEHEHHHHEHKHAHHHHKHDEACTCGHHDHEHHEEHCECGHHHDHHHHHEGHCSCGHHHEEHEHVERQVQGNYKWIIHGLDCAHCALKVEDAVNGVKGVKSATLNFTTKKLFFDLDENVNIVDIKEHIKQAILNVEEVTIQENETLPIESKKDYKQMMILIGVILFVLALIMKSTFIYLVSYSLIGYSVIHKSLKNIKRKDFFDENFLMTIATIGALIVGEYAEAVAVMLFYQIGEYFQDKAVAKSRESIAQLMDIKADIAHKVVGHDIMDVDPEVVHVYDLIVVRPGERIPLDSEVIEGNASIDTSALTGESIPADVEKGDNVLAGCINTNGLLKLKVLKTSEESTVSRIMNLVENASSKKAVTEQKMTKFARVYTPIVVFSALALAILPNLFNTGIHWSEWIMRACTFLVISCPCALVLSIPLGYFAGIGAASRKGVLIKGGSYLEALNTIDTVVFDKTGTLTNGKFKVVHIHSSDVDKCLEIAAYAESASNHPVALSILEAYSKDIHQETIESLEEIAGKGIHAMIQGKEVLVGNDKLMDAYKIAYPAINSASTIVYVAYDKEYLGTIEIADTIKSDAKDTICQLKNNGINQVIMLSGDKKERAEFVGKELGFDEIYAELLPEDKVNKVEDIIHNKGKVAYVGDGINDAPVLARCDLGIAMGGLGSEAAIEASDIVLMKDDLKGLVDALNIASLTQKIMNQNIIFIIGIKVGVLFLTLLGYADMWMGVFADVGVCLLAVLNAMRILKVTEKSISN